MKALFYKIYCVNRFSNIAETFRVFRALLLRKCIFIKRKLCDCRIANCSSRLEPLASKISSWKIRICKEKPWIWIPHVGIFQGHNFPSFFSYYSVWYRIMFVRKWKWRNFINFCQRIQLKFRVLYLSKWFLSAKFFLRNILNFRYETNTNKWIWIEINLVKNLGTKEIIFLELVQKQFY